MKRLQILALAATASIFASQPADAALSGYRESNQMLHALPGREDLADALKQQAIRSIEATRTGTGSKVARLHRRCNGGASCSSAAQPVSP